MIEGWWNEEYFSLFDESESKSYTLGYSIESYLPHYSLLGLIGWDDFLLLKNSEIFRCPTVPLCFDQLEKYKQSNMPGELVKDERFTNKIKWYIKPIMFGGSPTAQENISWVDYPQHQQLVTWWNEKHQETKA